ncbi:amino acid adenylation domain-containing protein [Pectobacterium actinidiae]|uniref:amino acid adenylation domain-containing protein n=1 Tax=Pectobacterium actinidiae TaxID=1507808 RepID=UPI0037F49A32
MTEWRQTREEIEQVDEWLREDIAQDLGIPAQALDADASFLKLGLDSMRLMAWMHRLRKRGHRVKLRDLYQQPTLRGWSQLLRDHPAVAQSTQASTPTLAPATSPAWPTMADGEPFALTPVQHAYLVGRAPHQTLGGVGCHLYQEFDGAGLDADALEQAIGALMDRHPMLTVTFLDDGRQQHRPGRRWRGLTLHDLRTCSPTECQAHLQAMRERHGHRVLAVEQGENFDFQLTLLPDGRHRLHADIDLLVMDAASFSLVFDELAAVVRGERLEPVSTGYDFRSYLSQAAQENEAARQQAHRFWMERLGSLSDAPQLPLACEPEQIKQVRISRQRVEIPAGDWARLQACAGEHGVTPTMALATCFGAVLARWCNQQRLLLNLTLFDRQPLHPAVDGMIADFTNILLLDIAGDGAHFAALAQANQQTFTDAYEHRHWSGVELLRELRKTPGAGPHGAPVVFTSSLGRPLFGQDVERTLGAPGWGISQTPQVWIDHLAYEHGGSVFLQWDSNAALFPPGLLDAMFQAYVGLVRRLLEQPQAWREALPDLMPEAQRKVRAHINEPGERGDDPVPEGLLHEGFFHLAQVRPQAVALLHGERRLSYGELAEQARRCAGALVAHGVAPGDTVAISMPKGIGQIIAVLGTLYAGAVYVPVSLDQPRERRETIYQGAAAVLVLVCQDARDDMPAGSADRMTFLSWQSALDHAPLPAPGAVDARKPAYIIYTSGSTGTPKGVIISHRGALNTCAELNRRYAVAPSDRVLSLSALHFDLSVYDIFGLLSAGGAVVLVDEGQRRDPAAWCEAIERHGVTLWNTVPALLDMLLTYSEGFALQAPARLRVVMLSGDWIGLDLPARYRAFRADGQFVAMGGATEASIWSNVYDVEDVPADWRSIPYGYPLARQKYRVADALERDCPDWVPGELWIGGEGVALGYFNDPQRSAQQFVTWGGERWYRTGDMGCYWPDGRLEFLGRRDKQVKVGGYRIELGEIEAALLRVEGVKSAVALAVGEREKSLAAFVVPQGPALFSARPAEPLLPVDYAVLTQHDAEATGQTEAELETDMARLVAGFLHEHLTRQGVELSTALTAHGVLDQYGARPQWAGLLTRWLEHLCAEGFVQRLSGDRHAPADDMPLPWHPPGGHPLWEIANALSAHHAPLAQILRGERPAQTLLNHPFWAPEQLLLRIPGMKVANKALAGMVRALATRLGRPVRLHEVGARSGLAAAQLLLHLRAGEVDYTAWDESPEMVLRASANLQRHAHADARRWHAEVAQDELHQADLVWANNALHRLGDAGVQAALALAAPSALVCVHELREASSLALVSAELLADGDDGGLALRLHDMRGWQTLLERQGMRGEASGLAGNVQWLVLRAPHEVLQPDPEKLSAALRDLLPSYMVPQRLFFLDALPLTANGKVDHRTLAQRCSNRPSDGQAEHQSPLGDTEQAVAALWCELLKADAVYRDSHFFQMGGDSLLATRLIGELSRRGYSAGLGDLFDFPTLAAFAATVRPSDPRNGAALRHDPACRHAPFPLTDVQQAYLVGRQPGFALGGVGSHFFVEFEVADLDVARFERAMNRLVERHDTLRAVVRDGMQQVLPEVPRFALTCHRVVDLDGEQAVALRERLARQVLDPSRWPVFDIQAAHLAAGTVARLYVCLDNLMLDGLSMQILLAELEQLYSNPEQDLPALEIGFRDYLAHLHLREVNAVSQAYWARRLDSLPPAPRLPLRCEPTKAGVPHFARLSARLSEPQWGALKARARAEGLTPSALLLSAYATTLSACSARDDLCLNLTLFDRQPLHPQIEQVLGDFTTLLLLAWQPAGDWRQSANRLQQRLRQDLLHRDVSAIQVMRQLARRAGQAAAAMPVVFTSALGFEQDRFLAHASWMKPRWGLSQTPQVWLDHQVYESEGELRFNWDYVQALFEPQQIQAMFDRYVALLLRLADDASAWSMPLEALVPRLEGVQRPAPQADAATAPPAADSPEAAALRADDALVQALCRHFERVVGHPIQPRQSFFDAGATSLKLVQLHVHLTQIGHGGLLVTDLFAHATPLALAMHLHGAVSEMPDTTSINEERRELLAQRKARAQRRRGSTL